MTFLTLLGSTGSIGTSTLDVVRRWPDRFGIYALVAGRNIELLTQQIAEFRPKIVVVAEESGLEELRNRLKSQKIPIPELAYGAKARVDAAKAPEAAFVMSAIVGVEGMEATYEAVRLGKRVGLANKETLVASGKLVIDAVKASGAELLPVDSEHNGAHQSFRAGRRDEVAKLILTASGGPFRNTPVEALAKVTPEQALNHPTWKMGPRITIDSATLMNKGFEVIEACWLFDLPPKQVEVVVHPQSKVHAMVEYLDGSVIAQISATDMRMPIQYALTYPDRAASERVQTDFPKIGSLTFEEPDTERFSAIELARRAGEVGGTLPAVLNAANEIAVEAFVNRKINFPQITETVRRTMAAHQVISHPTLDEILEADAWARRTATV